MRLVLGCGSHDALQFVYRTFTVLYCKLSELGMRSFPSSACSSGSGHSTITAVVASMGRTGIQSLWWGRMEKNTRFSRRR